MDLLLILLLLLLLFLLLWKELTNYLFCHPHDGRNVNTNWPRDIHVSGPGASVWSRSTCADRFRDNPTQIVLRMPMLTGSGTPILAGPWMPMLAGPGMSTLPDSRMSVLTLTGQGMPTLLGSNTACSYYLLNFLFIVLSIKAILLELIVFLTCSCNEIELPDMISSTGSGLFPHADQPWNLVSDWKCSKWIKKEERHPYSVTMNYLFWFCKAFFSSVLLQPLQLPPPAYHSPFLHLTTQ